MRLACVLCLLLAPVAAGGPPNVEDAPLRAITFADAREGWAVGDEGVVWHTVDAGKNWERQPTGTRASLRAVQFLSPYTGFVAGRTELPNRAGSVGVLLRTEDGGVTWAPVTSTLLPGLNAVQFFDDQRGVVAGDGSDAFPSGVFRTDDGGRSWHMLKGPRAGSWMTVELSNPTTGELVDVAGRKHAVADGVVGGAERPPFEMSANWTPGEGVKLFAGRKADEPAGQVAHIRGLEAAWMVGLLGTVWHTQPFPTGKPVAQRCGGRRVAVLFAFARSVDVPLGAVAALAADGYLCGVAACDADARFVLPAAVRAAGGAYAMRQPGGPDALRAKLDDIAPDFAPDVIVTDLPRAEAVKVAKVYAPAAGPGDGVVSLNLLAYVPELGGSPRDVAEPAALLLGPTPLPDGLHFKLVGGTLADAASHTSLMQGVHLGEGGAARRKKPAPADASREAVATTRRELDKLLAPPPTAESVTAAVAKLQTLPDADAARAGTMLGLRLAHSGRWTAARELFACVADHYSAHPDAVEAIRWLVRFHGSGEARRRVELGHFPMLTPKAFVEEPADRVQQASHTAGLVPAAKWRFRESKEAAGWVRTAVEAHAKLAAFGTAYARDPATVLGVGAANRTLGLPARAADACAALVTTVADPWAGRLGDELRLVNRPGEFPRGPELRCRFAPAKPFLDGQLDDACWKAAPVAEVADGTVRLVCDDQFLYVGADCKGPATGDKRPRDADPTDRDRLELLLDLDRDYTTGYRLAVDAAGSVCDDCWGDRGWNPKLFVATSRTAGGWAVEVAIPLAELTGGRPTPKEPWAGGVARRKPGETHPPVLGLLRFEAAK